jgi:hypothetical protein
MLLLSYWAVEDEHQADEYDDNGQHRRMIDPFDGDTANE